LLFSAVAFSAIPAFAQIPPATTIHADTTAGTMVTQSAPNIYKITGGTYTGPAGSQNLFQSFDAFSLGPLDTALWTGTNPNGVVRVVNRVTGGAVSQLDGTFQSDFPNADFYFINPAGVVLGNGFTFNVPRSFYVSTAQSLRFADGSQLLASGSSGSSFSAAAPASFGFLGGPSGDVVLSGLGYGISFNHASATFGIAASNVAVKNSNFALEAGALRINATGSTAVDIPTTGLFPGALSGNVTFDMTQITSGPGGVAVAAGNLTATNLMLYSYANFGTTTKAGAIDLRATTLKLSGTSIYSQSADKLDGADINLTAGSLSISGGSIETNAQGSGHGGSILINAGQLLFSGGALEADSYGDGVGGDITLRTSAGSAANTLSFTGGSIKTTAYGTGHGASIFLNAGQILLSGTNVEADTLATGDGGAISLQSSSGSIGLKNSFLRTVSGTEALLSQVGAAGDISLASADQISLVDSGIRSTSNATSTRVGSISLAAPNRVLIAREAIAPATDFDNAILIYSGSTRALVGDQGNITITAGSLETQGLADQTGQLPLPGQPTTPPGRAGIKYFIKGSQDGGNIDLEIKGDANLNRVDILSQIDSNYGIKGGNVTLHAQNIIANNATISSILPAGSSGSAGSLAISTAQDFSLGNLSVISASARGLGKSGNIDIMIGRNGTVAGLSRIENGIGEAATGAGIVHVQALQGTLTVTDRLDDANASVISSSTINDQSGGQVIIDAAHLALLRGGVIAATADKASGSGGSVTINTSTLVADGNLSGVTASAYALGNGAAGSIKVTSGQILLSNGADISTKSSGSTGGNISLTADFIKLLDGGTITTDTGPGVAGNILITMPRTGILQLQGDSTAGVITTSSLSNTGGTITIFAPLAVISNGGEIRAKGPGNEAKVNIVSDYFIRSFDRHDNILSVDGVLLLDGETSDVSRGTEDIIPRFVDAYGVLIGHCTATRSSGQVSTLDSGAAIGPYPTPSTVPLCAPQQVPEKPVAAASAQ